MAARDHHGTDGGGNVPAYRSQALDPAHMACVKQATHWLPHPLLQPVLA
jgi:hypothetical protein